MNKLQDFYRFSRVFTLATVFLTSACDKNTSLTSSHSDEDFDRIAKRFEAAGDYESSFSFYKQSLDKDPNNVSLRVKVGESSWKMGKYEEATFYAKSALEKDPNSFDAKRLLGRVLLAQEKGGEAMALFTSLLQERPEDPALLSYQGICFDMAGDHEKAQFLYRQALEKDPLNHGFMANLGLSLTLSGNYKEAIPLLEQVKAMPNASVRDRHNLALAYGLSGNLEKAEQIYSVDTDPANTRKNIERLAALGGQNPHAPVHVDTPQLLDSLRPEGSPSPEPKDASAAPTTAPVSSSKPVAQSSSQDVNAPPSQTPLPTSGDDAKDKTATDELGPLLEDINVPEKGDAPKTDAKADVQTEPDDLAPLDLSETDEPNKG